MAQAQTKKKAPPAATKTKPVAAPKKKRGGPRPPRTPEQVAAAAAKRSVSVKAALEAVKRLTAPASVTVKKDNTTAPKRAGSLHGFNWEKMGATDVGLQLDGFIESATAALTAALPKTRARGRQVPVGSMVKFKPDALPHYVGFDASTIGEVLEVIKPEKGGPIARVRFDTGDIERVPTARLVVEGEAGSDPVSDPGDEEEGDEDEDESDDD